MTPPREQESAPTWLEVCVSGGALLFCLGFIWAILPWQIAVMATCTAWLAVNFGVAGAHWVDEGTAVERAAKEAGDG